MKESETHEELLETYLAYFKAHEKWQARGSERTYYDTQKILRLMRRQITQILKDNVETFQNRPRPKGGVTK